MIIVAFVSKTDDWLIKNNTGEKIMKEIVLNEKGQKRDPSKMSIVKRTSTRQIDIRETIDFALTKKTTVYYLILWSIALAFLLILNYSF